MSLFDPTKTRPASIYSTLALLNNFIVNSHQFLNSFSENIEKKLTSVSCKITQLEILLSIIEAKLNSVPDLEALPKIEYAPQSAQLPIDAASTQPPKPPAPGPPPKLEISSTEPANTIVSSENIQPSDGKVPASDHPSYAPFLKMLKVGVPQSIVASKLRDAGLDDTVINDPSKLMEL